MSTTVNGTTGVTFPDGTNQNTSASGFGFKNRIINGAFMIDQRNGGASVTPLNGANTYTLDRWGVAVNQSSKLTVQQSTTAPTGFTNSLLITSSSAYSLTSTDYFVLSQKVEGFNTADFAWGTANAQPVTVSFKVRSSLTGTFGGVIRNNASNRFYPFTYTISSANTFEDKTVTLAGDTTGTWLTNSGTGLELIFSVGVGSTYSGTAGAWTSSFALSATGATSVVGTNGATFYITGVQLEKGSTATSFDYRPYGTELALCQRYYWITTRNSYNGFAAGLAVSSTQANTFVQNPVSMRATPTYGYSGQVSVHAVGTGNNITSLNAYAGLTSSRVDFAVASGLTAGQGALVFTENGASNYFYASAEL